MDITFVEKLMHGDLRLLLPVIVEAQNPYRATLVGEEAKNGRTLFPKT